MKPHILRHLAGENLGRFPVWFMRQAGRYLPSYREVRKEHSFWEMVTTPELAAKVSLLPLEALPVDGVIFFSDILTLPYGMGVDIEMKESIGPVILKPFRSEADFHSFKNFRPTDHTKFVGEAMHLITKKLPSEVALLGFAGAPWTVASYLTEGHLKKRQFANIKSWMFRDPKGLRSALELLGDATVQYLKYQRNSGAHVVQIFDTWLSEMPKSFFTEHYLSLLNSLIGQLKKEGLPVIYFAKQSHHLLDEFSKLECDVLSVDNLLTLGEVDRRTGGKFSLQGNLDPTCLLSDEKVVRAQTRRIVEEAKTLKKPAIINLGHGVFPETPVENARAFVEEARALWI
jgi:uroporphyrinogen decarboxylase